MDFFIRENAIPIWSYIPKNLLANPHPIMDRDADPTRGFTRTQQPQFNTSWVSPSLIQGIRTVDESPADKFDVRLNVRIPDEIAYLVDDDQKDSGVCPKGEIVHGSPQCGRMVGAL